MKRTLAKDWGGWPAGTVVTNDPAEWRRWKAANVENVRLGAVAANPNPSSGYPVCVSVERIAQLVREGYCAPDPDPREIEERMASDANDRS